MIELEKILEEIEELRGKVGSECTSEDHYMKKSWEYCLDLVEKIIRKHMNDKAEDGGWIPVEERLPDDGKTVLCTDGDYVYLVEYDADWDAPFGDVDGIIAWRPLPAPYRPERSDKERK